MADLFVKKDAAAGMTKTSAQIISEAKASISRPMSGKKLLEDIYAGRGRANQSAKLVLTERPFTPKPRERHLYPGRSNRPQSGSIHLQLIEEESGSSSIR